MRPYRIFASGLLVASLAVMLPAMAHAKRSFTTEVKLSYADPLRARTYKAREKEDPRLKKYFTALLRRTVAEQLTGHHGMGLFYKGVKIAPSRQQVRLVSGGEPYRIDRPQTFHWVLRTRVEGSKSQKRRYVEFHGTSVYVPKHREENGIVPAGRKPTSLEVRTRIDVKAQQDPGWAH